MINKPWISLPVVYSRPFASKAFFWAILKEFISLPLTVPYNGRTRVESMFKGLQHRSDFSPKNCIVLLSNFVAKRLKDSRLSLYLPIENPSKCPGASSQRKLKSHRIRVAEMCSKIHTCQPETVLLIASFWLDALLNNKHLPSLL